MDDLKPPPVLQTWHCSIIGPINEQMQSLRVKMSRIDQGIQQRKAHGTIHEMYQYKDVKLKPLQFFANIDVKPVINRSINDEGPPRSFDCWGGRIHKHLNPRLLYMTQTHLPQKFSFPLVFGQYFENAVKCKILIPIREKFLKYPYFWARDVPR